MRLPTPLGISLTQSPHSPSTLVVSAIKPEANAEGHLHVGDVITHVADQRAFSLNDVVTALAVADEPVHIVVERSVNVEDEPEVDDVEEIDLPTVSVGEKDVIGDVYKRQDVIIDRLIHLSSSRVDKDYILSVAADAVKSRATASPRSATLISSVVHRLQRGNVPFNNRFRNSVMSAYVTAGHPHSAITTFHHIKEPNVECFTTLIKAYSHLHRVDDALSLLPVMRAARVEPSIRTYNALIACCVNAGMLHRARSLFTEMLVDNIQPNAVSWNIIINWHVKSKRGAERVKGALNAFMDMKESGVEPNIITYTTLLKAYTKSGKLNKAEELFRELKTQLSTRIDTSVYNTMIAAYSGRLEWRRCLELLKEMKREATTFSPFKSVMSPLDPVGRSKHYRLRRPWLSPTDTQPTATPSSTRRSPLQPDSPHLPDAVTYSLCIRACASAMRTDIAEVLLEEMIDEGFYPPPPHAVVSILSGFAKQGRAVESLNLIKRARTWGMYIDQRMAASVMEACLISKQPHLALDVYQKLRGMWRTDVVVYTLLIRAHGMQGDWDKMWEILGEMRNGGVAPNVVTYNSMIDIFIKAGWLEGALRLLEEMEKGNSGTLRALTDLEEVNLLDRDVYEYLLEVTRIIKSWGEGRGGGDPALAGLYASLLQFCVKCKEWEMGGKLLSEREKGDWGASSRNASAPGVRMWEDEIRANVRLFNRHAS